MRSPAAPPRAGGRKAKPIPGEEYLVRRDGSDQWHIDITIQGRRLRRSSGTTEKVLAAEAARQAHEAFYREVVLGEAPARHMSLNEAFVRFYEEVAKGTTYGEAAQKHQMATMLEILGANRTLAMLDDNAVNDLVQALRAREIVPWNAPDDAPSRTEGRTLAPATVNRHITTLSAICRRATEIWGVEVGEWKLTKHKQEEPQGREVFLEQDQARELVATIIPHARPILLIELATGLRKANIHDLTWERVSLDLGRIVLLQKGGRPHTATLPPWACQVLALIEPEPARRTGPVFRFGNPAVPCECAACTSPAKKGQALAYTRRAFATATRNIGMPKLRFHDLRHSFASWLLAAGGDLQLVREALGHRDIQTTARYAHLVDGRREAVIGAATAGLLAPPVHEERKKA